MRWHLKRSKLLLALIPILSIVFYIFTVDHSLYADQSFIAFDIYRQICDTAQPVAGKNSPSDYSAAENFAIAADVYAKTDSVQCTITGQITAMGFYKQTVQNYHAKNGGYIFSESISLSAIASVAEQRFFKDRALLYRAGSASGGSVKGWSDTIVELDPAVYRQRYGVVPQEITKYSVTKDSVESGSLVSENPDGTYTYELIMNAQEAQKYSRYEMMTFAGVTAFPDYYSCRLVFTIDGNWRILELQSYDTYKIAIMGGTKCDSKLTGVYSYLENYMPERAQPFIDYVPTGNTGGVDSDKGPADYLSEAFGSYITGNEKLNIDATVTVKDTPLELKGQIDIKNMDFRFALGDDIFAVYKGNSLYLALGNGKYALDINELSNCISKITGKPSNLLGGLKLDDSILGTLFENHSIVKTDTHVFINMPFEMFGMKLDVKMGLKKLDDGTTAADTIDAVVTVKDIPIGVQAKITDNVTLPEFDKKEYVSLAPALDAVANTLAKPSYALSGNIGATVNENVYALPFSAEAVKTAKGANVQVLLNLFGVDVTLYYIDETVYAEVGNIKIKAATNDFAQIAQTVAALIPQNAVPDLNPAELLEKLMPQILPALDIPSALGQLSGIKYSDNTLTLNVQPQSGLPWSLKLTHDTFLRSVAVNGLEAENVKINLDCALSNRNGVITPIETDTFTDVKAVLKYIPAIKKLAEAKSFTLELSDASVVSDKFGGKMSGTVKFNLPDANSPVTAYVDLKLGDLDSRITEAFGLTDISAEILFDGEYAYLTMGNFAVKGSVAAITQILQKFGIVIPSVDNLSSILPVGAENLDIASILDKVSVTESENGLALKISSGENAEISVLLDESGNAKIAATVSSGEVAVNAQAALTSSPAPEILKPADKEYTDAADFIKFIDPVINTVNARTFKITLSNGLISKDGYEEPFTGVVTVSLLGASPEISANVNVSGQTIGIMYKENSVYIRSGNLALMLELKDSQTLLDAFMPLLSDIPAFVAALSPDTDVQALETIIKSFSDIIESFKPAAKPQTGNKLQSTLATLGRFPTVIPALSFDSLTSLLGGITVNGNEITIAITPASGTSYSITIGTNGEYIDKATISALTFEGFVLNLNAELECNSEFNLTIGDKKDYVNLASLAELAPALHSLMGTAENPASNYEIQITESELYSAVISGMISGTVNIGVNPFKAQATLKLNSEGTVHDILFAYADKTIYLKINDIMLTSSTDDIERLKNEILSYGKQRNFDENTVSDLAEAVYALTARVSLIENLLGGKTLGEIFGYVDSLTQNEDGTVTAAMHVKDLSASVRLIPNADSLTLKIGALNYSGAIFNSAVTLTVKAIPAFAIAVADKESYVNLKDLIPYINPAMNTVTSDNFNLSFAGDVKAENGSTTVISGKLEVIPTQKLADVYAQINLKEYSGSVTENATPDKSTLLELYIIDAKDENSDIEAFINYNGFYAKIKYEDALRILGSVCDILDLDIPIIDMLVADAYKDAVKTDVFSTMDIAGLDSLRNKINSLFAGIDISSFTSGNKLMNMLGLISDSTINKALKGISLSFKQDDGSKTPFICVNIDNRIFESVINPDSDPNADKADAAQEKSVAEITLGHNGEKLTFANIANLRVNGNTVNFKADLLDDAAQITLPENNWLDFSSADDLLYAVMNTADTREFHISGEVKLTIFNAIDVSLQIGATIKILPDGNTVAAIKLTAPYFALGALKASESYIYFANNMLYFVVDNLDKNGNYESTSFESATVKQFLANPVDYMFRLVRLADWIENLVKNSINGTKGTPTDKLQDILKNYSYSENIVNVKIGLAELAGDKNLSDLLINMTTDNGFMTGLYLSTKFAGIAELTLAGKFDGDGNMTAKYASLDNLNYVDGHVAPKEDGTFTHPLPDVDYGRSKETANAGLSAGAGEILAIDNMEDALARLFPVEAAETFAQKATDKAEKANRKAAAAKAATENVNDCTTALALATEERQNAEKKLYGDENAAGIPEGSFGYEFALSQLNAAKAAEKRAQTQLTVALKTRSDATADAIEIAEDAAYYAQKAFEAGEKLTGLQDARAQAAANTSAIAATAALEATRDALKAAIEAATDAQDVETTESAATLLTQTELGIISITEKIATRCNNYVDSAAASFSAGNAEAAFASLDNALLCSQSVKKAESAADNTALNTADSEIKEKALAAAKKAKSAIAEINATVLNRANTIYNSVYATQAAKENLDAVKTKIDSILSLLQYAEKAPQLSSDTQFMSALSKTVVDAATNILDKYGKLLYNCALEQDENMKYTYLAFENSAYISKSSESSDRKSNSKVNSRIELMNTTTSEIGSLSSEIANLSAKLRAAYVEAIPLLDESERIAAIAAVNRIFSENANLKTAYAQLQDTVNIAVNSAVPNIKEDVEKTSDWTRPLRITLRINSNSMSSNAQTAQNTVNTNYAELNALIEYFANL